LVELMVAMVIGLIVSLAVFSVLQTFEGRKRSTTSVNDIDQAGNYALYTLDKLLRSAGSGLSQSDGAMFGCTLSASKGGTQVLPRTAALPAPFATVNTGIANIFKLAPILIVPSTGSNNSDALVIMSGNGGFGEVATQFSDKPSGAQLKLSNTIGFRGNDLVLINNVSAGPAGTPCLIEQVSPAFTGGAITDLPLSGQYYNASINGTGIASYTDVTNTMALNLGNVVAGNPPTFLVIGVGANNTLFGFDLLQNQNPTNGGAQASFPIADSVFELHALYGIDTDNDGKVNSWTQASGNYAPASLTNGSVDAFKRLKTIKAIRIGLIASTSMVESTIVAPAKITLFPDLDTSLQATRTFSSTGNDLYYRYRTIETTVPLRNQIMLSD